jgi:CheY-like chemotaxis protein
MMKWPAPNGNGDLSAKTQECVTALVGFLCLAEAANLTAEQRAQFSAAATRQAQALREQFKGRLLIIVDRQQAEQYDRLKRAFAHDGDVEVVVDRRQGERRGGGHGLVDRRERDRRQRKIEADLARLGVALVPEGAMGPWAAAALASANGRSDAAMNPAQDPSTYRVLLIDDDPAIVQLLSSFFEVDKEGYLVDKAFNGEKGLAAVMAHRPDVVLLDISMPGMSGLEVLKRIRAIDAGIPVIMVTAAPHQATSEALKNGAFAYIPKPFDFRYIDHLVRLATERSASSRPRR